MEPIRLLDAVAAPMPAANIDTDQILPARFLPKLRSEGLDVCLFRDLRFDADGKERAEFILNRAPYRGAAIIVAGRNFGCGSSREAAVYALYDHGIRAIVSGGFGDIFRANCYKNGLLPVSLAESVVSGLIDAITAEPGARLRIDLASQTLCAPDGAVHCFHIDGMRKHMLMHAIDEIDYTLGMLDRIADYERARAKAEAAPE
jgi:3-isopropylmalate/(R)-2-methylmalate dehydratase small subunit